MHIAPQQTFPIARWDRIPPRVSRRRRGLYADVVLGARRRRSRRLDWHAWPTLGRLLDATGFSVAVIGPRDETYELDGCEHVHAGDYDRDAEIELLEGCRLYIGDDSPESRLAANVGTPRLIVLPAPPSAWTAGEAWIRGAHHVLHPQDARYARVIGAAWDFLDGVDDDDTGDGARAIPLSLVA